MVRLRVLDILEEQDHTKYWLYKQMEMSYQNFSKLINNETRSIRYENIEKLSKLLNCPVGDLFETVNAPDEEDC
ncbi:MAG: helix-turn-helix transcriptional regulator [Lachnospiraceae bacterium]|jgi:DNA-binding Xre family transcriptional regulator